MDQLVICKHCGGDACYETTLDSENNKAWMCYGCGFSSNSHYVNGSEGY
jgi:transcription elongation factor Elf1